MSTDRELLQAAAKAAGIDGPIVEAGGMLYVCNEQSPLGIWAPLTDDGDALRLAVKLRLWVGIDRGATYVADGDFEVAANSESESHGSDPYAATRRAIVRAAAALGEQHDQ